VLWAAAEQWYFPHKLPLTYGTKFWEQVFKPRGDAITSLVTSTWIALATVVLSLTLAVPAGYALARLRLPWRSAILLTFLLPQAFPSLAVYINIARIFYEFRLNGTMTGVILVHTVHGLVFAVWITAAAFAAVERDLELAARNVDVDGQAGERLRQQEGQQDRAAPGQFQAREGIARGHRQGEAQDHGGEGDPGARDQRGEGIAARFEHLVPELGAVGERQLVREIPLLGGRPKHQVGQRAEHDEREQPEDDAAA
jgi:hypothetical protein